MPTTADLIASVQSALGAANSLGYSNISKAHDVYEGYILALLCRAADDDDWDFELRDELGNTTTHAAFRLGPGRLPSGSFTYVYLSKKGHQPLEAHIGVKVFGNAPRKKSRSTKSGYLLHEFDLLVLPSAVADICRQNNSDPSHKDVIIHAEAKFYGGDIPLPIGRSVVGLSADCALQKKSVLVTNRNGLSVEDLLASYDIEFRFLVKPSDTRAEYHMVLWFKQLLAATP